MELIVKIKNIPEKVYQDLFEIAIKGAAVYGNDNFPIYTNREISFEYSDMKKLEEHGIGVLSKFLAATFAAESTIIIAKNSGRL